MTQGEPEEFNPPFITVSGGIDRFLVVVMVWESRDEEYKVDQVLERRPTLEAARQAADEIGQRRRMEVR